VRVLFLFLLLLNVAYFGWHYFYPPTVTTEQAVSANAGNNGVPSLTLLGEGAQPKTEVAQAPQKPQEPSQPAAQKPVTAPPPVKPAPPPIRRCLAVGPTQWRAVLDRLHAKLAKGGVDAAIDEAERQIPIGFWVHLPAVQSERDARLEMRALQAKGVRDIAITPTEDKQFIVSLGVFSQADTSADRLAMIKRLGYKEVMREPRYKSLTEYTLTAHAEGKAAERLETTVKEMKAQLGKVPVDLSSCLQP